MSPGSLIGCPETKWFRKFFTRWGTSANTDTGWLRAGWWNELTMLFMLLIMPSFFPHGPIGCTHITGNGNNIQANIYTTLNNLLHKVSQHTSIGGIPGVVVCDYLLPPFCQSPQHKHQTVCGNTGMPRVRYITKKSACPVINLYTQHRSSVGIDNVFTERYWKTSYRMTLSNLTCCKDRSRVHLEGRG